MDNTCFPTIEQIRQAREVIAPHLYRTPMITSDLMNEQLGCSVSWKLENLQKTHAFKVRGGLNRLAQLSLEERTRGIVAASSGNHGIGVSYAALALGTPATVVMPVTAPTVKQERIRRLKAEVILKGNIYDESLAFALEYAREQGRIPIPSFDDPHIVAGQGTMALEILEDQGDLDAVVFPIGGGGLAAGLGVAFKALAPKIKLYGVQPQTAPSSFASLKAGRRTAVPPAATVADALAVMQPGVLNFAVMQEALEDIITVDEKAITKALQVLVNTLKVIVEPGAAVSLAALMKNPRLFAGKRVACILTGANVDAHKLNQLLQYQCD